MKSKCTFILKASLSLVLALLMVFGTMATSFAVAVDNSASDADTAADDMIVGALLDSSVTAIVTNIPVEKEADDSEVILPALKKSITDLADTGWDASYSDKSKYYIHAQIATSGGGWSSTYNDFYFNSDGRAWIELKQNYGYKLVLVGSIDGYWYKQENGSEMTQGTTYYMKTSGTESQIKPTTTSGMYLFTLSGLYDDDGTRPKTLAYSYAKATSYTITYNKGSNGTGTNTTDTKYQYKDITLKGSTFTRTGYTQDGWSTTDGGAKVYDLSANYTGNAALTLYPHWKANTYTITYSKGTYGTGTNTSATKTYGVSLTLLGKTFTRAGYDQIGWASNAAGTTHAYNLSASYTSNSATTLYPEWSELTSSLTVQAGSNGSITKTGTTSGVASYVDVTAVTPGTGYVFSGWTVTGTDASHVRIKNSSGTQIFNGTSWTSGTNTTEAIRVYTDGSAADLSATVTANFVSNSRSFTVGTMVKDDTGAYTTTKATASSNTGDGFTSVNTQVGGSSPSKTMTIGAGLNLTTHGDYTATDTQNTVDNTFSYTKYKFMGWKSFSTAQTSIAASNTTWDSTSASYSPTVAATTNQYWYAVYKKYYVFCAYNSYDHDQGAQGVIIEVASPPTQYSASATGSFEAYPSQGKKYAIPAGETLRLKYSALASSDCIDHVYYDNTTQYTTATPTAANFSTANLSELTLTTDYTVDNNNHIISIPMKKNVKNITIGLGTKWRIFFEDTDGVIINSKNIDNFYTPDEAISGGTTATNLSVTAEKSSTQINEITGSSIAIYYATADGKYATGPDGATVSSTPVAVGTVSGVNYATITKPSGTSTATASANGTTLSFPTTGTMPNCNVIIKLNTAVTYNLYLGSKCVADATNTADAMGDVANVYLKNGTTTVYTAGGTPTTVYGPNAVTKGQSRTYNYTWKNTYGSYYMFIGWYKGTSSGPDYASGYITDKDTLNYTPREHTYIWAVCTRDLFINGSKEITGGKADWKDKDGNYKNFKMKFDPDYENPEGGARGRYYWEITDTIFNAATNKKYTVSSYYKGGDTYYYMNSTNYSSPGNSFFQFFDVEENDNNQGVWKGITSFENVSHAGVHFGKIYPENDSYDYKKQHGYGWIKFSESDFAGYSAPLYIYYYPGKGFSVEATYVPVNIYMSHGYGIGSTTRNANATTGSYLSSVKWLNGTTESSTNITGPIGSGFSPWHEGHVNHYTVNKKEATVRVKKDCASTEQVTAFFVYDLYTNSVHAMTDVKSTSNTYYADFTTQVGHDLYIVPVIEVKTADMTVYFDASQLNTDRWGKIVTCYAWYSDNSPACGEFPGQPMVPSDDGTSWVAKFPSSKPGDSSKKIAGITFSNYIDGENKNGTYHGHSWLGETDVLDSVSYTNAGNDNQTYTLSNNKIVHLYNLIGTGYNSDGTVTHKYEKVNCKVQTYDYREPISYYTNSLTDDSDDITLTFAIKMGNSDDLMSMKHSELKNTSSNLFTNMAHNNSSGASEPKTFSASKNFEYLTNAKGDTYKDLNGNDITGKPTATYYVLSKGQVVYDGSNLSQVFWSSNRNESKTSQLGYPSGYNSVPTGTGAVNEVYPISISSMSYAVQWYIYDASGNYITNMLSAGYADDVSTTDHDNTLIGKKLKDLGYAVDGKAVAICYDKPRALNTDDSGHINSGTGFNAYRATGQWYRTEQIQPVTVTAKVGMMTDSGEVLSENNVDGYGSATAKYDTAKGSSTPRIRNVASPTPLGSEYGAVTTALKDAENQPVRLTASESNFIGWYYYDSGTGKFTKAKYESPTNFYPNYTKDITYYAMYRAAAIYKYKYQGREGDDYYTVGGGDLTSSELATNKVDSTQSVRQSGGDYDIAALAPGASNVSVFKKTLNFSGLTSYDNNTLYTLNIGTATKSTTSYTLTYYCPNSKGGAIASHTISKEYGKTVDLSSANAQAYAPDNQVFMGWYLYDTSKSGDARYTQLLTTQGNYGFVMIKDMTIAARYGSAAATDSGWKAFIDDNGVTKEMTSSSSGRYYNDTIVRFRNGVNAAEAITNGAEVGVLIIDDGATGTVGSPNTTQLNTMADGLGNNERGKVGSSGKTVTKLCKTVASGTLTYYNRYDFALKGDYTAQKGHKYGVYAYLKIGSTYYWSDVASGSYT